MPPANKGRRYPAEPMTAEEVRALIAAVPGEGPLGVRNRALIALLWRSGLRITEALKLKPTDVDEREGTVRVRNGKGSKDRVAVIDSEALGYLRAWLEVRKAAGINGRAPIFCSIADGAKGAGVRKPGKELHGPHSLRPRLTLARQASSVTRTRYRRDKPWRVARASSRSASSRANASAASRSPATLAPLRSRA